MCINAMMDGERAVSAILPSDIAMHAQEREEEKQRERERGCTYECTCVRRKRAHSTPMRQGAFRNLASKWNGKSG